MASLRQSLLAIDRFREPYGGLVSPLSRFSEAWYNFRPPTLHYGESVFALKPSWLRQVVALAKTGGEWEIRTLDKVAPITVFETVPFNRSGNSPWLLL